MENSSKEEALKAIEHFILSHEKKMAKKDNLAKDLLVNHGYTENKLSLTQLHIMALINEYPNASNNTFLSKELSISKPAITKAINSLIEEGMVLSKKKENDQKAVYYTLTNSGQQLAAVHDRMHQIAEDRYIQLLDQFSDDELELIIKFLEAWSNQL
ncbi:MarR family transcriptional regulator [Oceanobacillus neutriphilus]|uniref:HTH-type transcriptional regulator YvnA n=1 Tax=Oceanobacillus neutriphilus TaxID=531815 RepID=A0ABQ2P216_9BACI|nr:MarR family transcriptional regulator [Oceanobacillus neutriphilus]GGP16310.1 putative HTH-type transcriptional regulator YvnA [Oceanobacillus neutriphilus]